MLRLAICILLLALLQLRLGVEVCTTFASAFIGFRDYHFFPQSTNYEVIGVEKMFGSRCEGEDNTGNVDFNELVDLSQLNMVYDDDYETVHLSGKIVLKKELPARIKMHIEIYRWVRDKWVPTAVSLKRDDFCKSLKNPFEPWHFYVISQIPQEQLVCPPKLGVSCDRVGNIHIYNFTLSPF